MDGLFLPLGGGLSAEVRGALAEAVQRDGVPAGVIRSRRVAIDFALLGERVQGLLGRPEADPVQDRAPLVFNFFDDTSVEVVVDAVEPAVLGNGYVVSGSLQDQPGNVVLGGYTRVGPVSSSKEVLLALVLTPFIPTTR